MLYKSKGSDAKCPLIKVLLYFPVVFSDLKLGKFIFSLVKENVMCLHEAHACHTVHLL